MHKLGAICAITLTLCFGSLVWAGEPANPEQPQAANTVLDPREAGARYGQALGVALMCYGAETTPAATRLPDKFGGAERTAFQAEADKVLTAWREASSCRNAGGPNPCRLLHEWSCRDAMKEIGPQGTKLPGLITEKTSAHSNK